MHGARTVRPHTKTTHLEHHVEHVWVRLFDLVKQHHGVGPAAHSLRQLAALLVAHVACVTKCEDDMYVTRCDEV
jgi:hypothetical protein